MSQRDCNGITQQDNTSPVAVASGRERPCKGLLLPIRTDAKNAVKEIATGYTTRQALEAAALAAHADGMTWAEFWPSVAGDVAAAEPSDRQRYRRLVARLTALVAAGDVDGTIPPQDGYGRPMDWELDELATAATAAGKAGTEFAPSTQAEAVRGQRGEVGPRHRAPPYPPRSMGPTSAFALVTSPRLIGQNI